MPICFLYAAFVVKHTERQKVIKPLGMTIVTVSGAPDLSSAPASPPELLPALANQGITTVGEAEEMPGPRWCFSHDDWSCCPPH